MILTIEPWIDEEELNQLKRVIDSTYVTEGPLTKEFENLIKNYTNAKYCISYSNGTLALYASLLALNIGEGDEVIIPDLTFVATANAVIMTGAKPVFCDINCSNFGINYNNAEKLITKRTKAIIPVHLYGKSCNVKQIKELCEKYNLFLIEDAAQGMGVFESGKHVGTFGEIGVLSFYGNKTITTGEGGVCLTNNEEIANSLYMYKNHGRKVKGTFYHERIGYNFSFTDLQAAIGISQIGKLERIINRRYEIYNIYKKFLNDKIIPYDPNNGELPWLVSIKVKNPLLLEQNLIKNNIQTRRFFYPLHLQPCYKQLQNNNNLIKSKCAYESHISLPSSHNLKDQEIKLICEILLRNENLLADDKNIWCKTN